MVDKYARSFTYIRCFPLLGELYVEHVRPLGAEVLPGEVEVRDVRNLHEVEFVQERMEMGTVRQNSGLIATIRSVAQLPKSEGNICLER